MKPQDFLAVILPSPGHGVYCTVELTSKKKKHAFVHAIKDFGPWVKRWHAANCDVYMAMATFDEKVLELGEDDERRVQANASYLKAVWLDLDGYPSYDDASAALNKLLADTELISLGKPWVVGSGGGLHVYWPLTREVTPDEWRPLSRNLQRLCAQEQMRIDNNVMGDSARVLRIPGTTNFKKDKEGNWKYGEPQPVRLLEQGDTFDPEAFGKAVTAKLKAPALAYSAPAKNVIQLPGARPTASFSPTQVKLFENTTTLFKNIWQNTAKGRGCNQLAYYREHADEDDMEPLWRALLSLTKFSDDGELWSERLSSLHPYDTDRMHRKLAEIKGPYLCATFDEQFPGRCDGCPARKRVPNLTTPMQLGREVMTNTDEAQVAVETETHSEVEEPVATITRPQPPRGYSYGDKGGVFVELKNPDADEDEPSTKKVMILPFDLFVTDVLHVHGKHMAHFVALRPQGPQDLMIDAADIPSKDLTLKALAAHNVLASMPGLAKHLHEYVWASFQQVHSTKPTAVPDNFGWQKDRSFVHAGRIFRKGQKPVKVPMESLENLVRVTQPTGSLEAWQAFIQMLVRRRMYKQLCVFLLATGAPLMEYTAFNGLTVHCCSTESGTGKTTALQAAASVWGHPSHYRTGKSTSAVAMQQRLGMLHSLPLVTDEITNKNRNQFEWFADFLFEMTEGRGKERMESGANKERLNLSTWYTVAVMSSNTHAVEFLLSGRKHSSEGEVRRVLEFVIDDVMGELGPEDTALMRAVTENYGVASFPLVQYLVDNEHILKNLVSTCYSRVQRDFNATSDERYWIAGVACAVAMGILLSDRHTGLVNLPLDRLLPEFLGAIEYMRKAIKSNARSASGVIDQYIQENYGQFLILRKTTEGIAKAFGDTDLVIDKSLARNSIKGRVENDFMPGLAQIFIEAKAIRKYANDAGFGWESFVKKLSDDKLNRSVAVVRNKTMSANTEAPPFRVDALVITRDRSDVDGLAPPSPSVAVA